MEVKAADHRPTSIGHTQPGLVATCPAGPQAMAGSKG